MSAEQRYTAAEVIEALEASAGIKTAAAQRLGCHVNTVRAYCDRYSTVAAAAKQQDESIIDVAESVIVSRLNDKTDKALQFAAAKFVLTTKGKERGWGNSIDVNVKVDEIARQLAAEYGEDEARIKAELIDLDAQRRKRSA